MTINLDKFPWDLAIAACGAQALIYDLTNELGEKLARIHIARCCSEISQDEVIRQLTKAIVGTEINEKTLFNLTNDFLEIIVRYKDLGDRALTEAKAKGQHRGADFNNGNMPHTWIAPRVAK